MTDDRAAGPTAAAVAEIVARKAARALDATALATIFTDAHTANGFLPVPIPRALLERIVALAHLGPTSSNSTPLRVVFVESPAAKARLLPALSPGNVEKTAAAPVTAIFAVDLRFYEKMPRLNPHSATAGSRFAGAERAAAARAFGESNATMQGAYVTVVARALGLDAGPMGGFDRAKVDAEFFPDGSCASLWLCNLGYADDAKTRPRGPRLPLDEVVTFL